MNIAGHRSASIQGLQGKSGRVQGNFSVFKVGLRPIVDIDAALRVLLNGADVSDIGDGSGNGNDVSQGTAADQLLFNAVDSDLNNKPSIEGDGVSEFLRSGDFVVTQPESIFLAYKMGDLVGTQTLFSGNASGDVTAYRTSTTIGQMRTGGTAQAIHTEDTNPHVLALKYDDASSDSWRDGIQTTPAASVGTQGLGGLTLLANQSAVNFVNGKLARYIVFDANLSDAARNYLGRGFAAKYGTTNGWS